MPDRFQLRKPLPFVDLSLHKRRDEVVRLGWRIARQAAGQGSALFWTAHLLEDPQAPQRQHDWVDLCFIGTDRHTLWTAALVTTQLATQEAIHERAFKAAHAQLTPQQAQSEFATRWVAVPRTHPGQMRLSQWVQRPAFAYPQFAGRTFAQECERLEGQLRATDPQPVAERFVTDRSYPYGVGLHAVVAEPTLDRAAIERTIARFRAVGEGDWSAPALA